MLTLTQRGNKWWIHGTLHGHRVRESLHLDTLVATHQDALVCMRQREQALLTVYAHGGFVTDLIEHYRKYRGTVSTRDASTLRLYDREWGGQPLYLATGQWWRDAVSATRLRCVSGPTLRRELDLICAAYKYAQRTEFVDTIPWIDKPKAADADDRWFTKDQRDRLLAAAAGTEIAPVLWLLFYTGCRKGEGLDARWTDVIAHGDKRVIVYGNRKNPNSELRKRNVALREDVYAQLEQRHETHVLRRFDGKHWPDSTLFTQWKSLLRECGFDSGWKLHHCRHTFASLLVQADKPLPVVQELLGHAHISMTMRYAHLAPNQHYSAVDSL